MTFSAWLFVMGALGFIDGWLACWWISLIAEARRQRIERRDG